MALPFLTGPANKRDQMLSVDLGGRTTKAVHLQRKGDRYVLCNYALLDAPMYDKSLSADLLGEHLKNVCLALNGKARNLSLSIGVNDSIVRHAELPQMPVGDMRQVLKNNTKNYLQQDLPGHCFDCFIIPQRATGPQSGNPLKSPSWAAIPKAVCLVAGARKQLIEEMQNAVKNTGFIADQIVPGLLGPCERLRTGDAGDFCARGRGPGRHWI